MERARGTEREGEAKNKPGSASQSRSRRGEEAQRVCVCVAVPFKGEKTVAVEGLHRRERRAGDGGIALVWDGGFYGAGMEKGGRGAKERKPLKKRACNMASQHSSYT